MKLHALLLLCSSFAAVDCNGQRAEGFTRANTFTMGAEFSENSSKIFYAEAENREWAALRLGYSRRLVRLGPTAVDYHAELRPLLFEGDPLSIVTHTVVTSAGQSTAVSTGVDRDCKPGEVRSVTFGADGAIVAIDDQATRCGRQWTPGAAISPAGIQFHTNITRRFQPFVTGTLGVMFTTRGIPAPAASAANFLIQTGVGFEFFTEQHRSLIAEYRVQHVSSNDLSQVNPGVENQVVSLAYGFGR